MRTLVVTAAALAAAQVLLVAACASTPRGGGSRTGEELYRSHCGSCHRLHDPRERTRAEWEVQVERMAPRAHLAGVERAAVLEYLLGHAKDAQPSGASR